MPTPSVAWAERPSAHANGFRPHILCAAPGDNRSPSLARDAAASVVARGGLHGEVVDANCRNTAAGLGGAWWFAACGRNKGAASHRNIDDGLVAKVERLTPAHAHGLEHRVDEYRTVGGDATLREVVPDVGHAEESGLHPLMDAESQRRRRQREFKEAVLDAGGGGVGLDGGDASAASRG